MLTRRVLLLGSLGGNALVVAGCWLALTGATAAGGAVNAAARSCGDLVEADVATRTDVVGAIPGVTGASADGDEVVLGVELLAAADPDAPPEEAFEPSRRFAVATCTVRWDRYDSTARELVSLTEGQVLSTIEDEDGEP